MSIRAVIPSISRDPGGLEKLVESLGAAGVDAVVVANARTLAEQLDGTDVVHIDTRNNAGFSSSVNRGATVDGHWDWLFVCNDDVVVAPERLAAAVAEHLHGDEAQLVYFDEEADRPVPGLCATWLSISLVGALLARLQGRGSRSVSLGRSPRGVYRSFSAVAVSKALWDEIGPLDERMRFTYEDVDYVRRVLAARASVSAVSDSGIVHEHSVSGTRHIKAVLPVSAWGATVYLSTWETRPWVARAVVCSALVARLLLVPVSRGSRQAHLAGIGLALRAVVSGREPHLPKYEDL